MATITKEKRKKALELVQATIEKNIGKGTLITGNESVPGVEFFSSGSIKIDSALGGGWAKGRIIEVLGPESSGKTTICLHAIAERQKLGGICAFIDVEHALDPQYASALGVDMESLMVSQPDTGEDALEVANLLTCSNSIDLIIIDSVAALVPKAELEGEIGDSHVGRQARLMGQAMRMLAGKAHTTETTIIFINQIRHKIGVMFGSPETTAGGNALKFYASQRVDIRRTGGITDKKEIVGNTTKIKVVKNKVAPPYKIAEFDIRYGEGIHIPGEIFDMALEKGLLEKSGSWFSYKERRLGQGKTNSCKVIEEDTVLFNELKEKVSK